MQLALELDPNHLFFWEPILFADTPFAINRVVLLMFVGSLACLAFFLIGSRRSALVPKGIQNLAESAYLFVRNNFPVTSRMAIPFALAILTWIIFNFVGIKKRGLTYFKDILFPPGVPKGIYIILTPIELFSTFIIRPLTLMIRLLANMMAGHVLLTIFFLFTHEFLITDFNVFTAPLGILTAAVAAILIVFELLVISIQAYIFTMLTAFYIAESIHGHGEAEHEDETAQIDVVPEHEVEGLKPRAA